MDGIDVAMRWPRRGPESTDPQRGRIAAAIVALVGRQGWRTVDLDMVLAEADVDAMSFGRHFADLEDCFCTVYQELATDFLIAAGAAFSTQETWRERIRAIAYTMLDYLEDYPPRAGFLFVEVLFVGERAQRIREENMKALYPFIDLGRQERPDPDSLSPALAEAIAGGIYDAIRLQVSRNRHDPEAWAAIVPQLMYSVVEPYLGSEAALEELHVPRPARARVRSSV